MRHLKVLKERVQQQNVEVDLRGFGEEPLFKHHMPQTVLSIHKSHESEGFKKDCQSLGVHSQASVKLPDWTHHTSGTGLTMNYKVQAVHLFSIALKNLSGPSAQHLRWRLWETNPFAALMRSSQHEAAKVAPPAIDDFFDPNGGQHQSHPLWLAPATALHLKQAGFEIGDATEKGLGLHFENCQALYKKEIEKLAAHRASLQVRKKATGGR